MPIDVDVALAAELDPIEFSWTSSDVQLYHLGLGAGADPMDPRELRYLVDDTPQVLPTFGNVAATFHMTKPPTVQFPGIDIELGKVLHASERVEVPGPLPPSGSARAVTRFTDIWDKGKAAVIWSETTVTAPDGTLLWTQRRSIFARGEGGFGGERGPSTSDATPDRAPDVEVSMPILPQQALLYRLCGDRNPLHSDPGIRRGRRLSAADPARPVHVRHDVQGHRRHAAGRRRRRGGRLRRTLRRRGLPRRDAQRSASGRKTGGYWPALSRPRATTRWCCQRRRAGPRLGILCFLAPSVRLAARSGLERAASRTSTSTGRADAADDLGRAGPPRPPGSRSSRRRSSISNRRTSQVYCRRSLRCCSPSYSTATFVSSQPMSR